MKGAGSAGRGALTNVPAGRIASAAQARKLRRRHARGHLRSGKAAKASKARVRGLSMAVQTAHADGLASPFQDALCSALTRNYDNFYIIPVMTNFAICKLS